MEMPIFLEIFFQAKSADLRVYCIQRPSLERRFYGDYGIREEKGWRGAD